MRFRFLLSVASVTLVRINDFHHERGVNQNRITIIIIVSIENTTRAIHGGTFAIRNDVATRYKRPYYYYASTKLRTPRTF